MPGSDEGRHQVNLLALVDDEHMPQQVAKVVAVAPGANQADRLAFYALAIEFGGFGTARLPSLRRIDTQVADVLDVADHGFAATQVANLDGVAIEDT